MAKSATLFVCEACGASSAKWSGRCNNCGAWNSLIEQRASSGPAKSGTSLSGLPLSKTLSASQQRRYATNMNEVDNVLGGGIVPGSVLLLAGQPGIGKSTLLLQVAAALGKSADILYVSAEESLEQVGLRAKRLAVSSKGLQFASSTSADDIAATIYEKKYNLLIVDSIQTVSTSQATSASGTISQITNSAQVLIEAAKSTGTAVLLVGHVTKEGQIAGPKLLEHLVDVVLYLEGERFGGFKILRSAKNRFGSTFEVGIFEMTEKGLQQVANPSAAFLEERQAGSDGSVVMATIEGSRAVLLEIQALVAPTAFGYPKRTSVGFDLNRLHLLLAVLGRRAGIDASSHDVYVNVVGGLRVSEPAGDLAVCLAVASALKKAPVATDAVVFGEVGLSGEIRSVPLIATRLKEATKLKFSRAIGPKHKELGADGLSNLREAIERGLK